MKTLHRIVSDYAKNGTKVEISRRELAKIRQELKREPVRRTPLTTMMSHRNPPHENKVRWPVRDQTFTLETEVRVRDTRKDSHPMIENRKISYPMPRVQGKRTR